MSKKVVVIDYGIGNIFSICNAFTQCGADVVLSSDKDEIKDADRLVLPGVGAFVDGMDGLKKQGFDSLIRDFGLKERPFLGICLGMQMMFDASEEFGISEGLGLIRGRVVKIPEKGEDGPHNVPHIGWSPIYKARSQWTDTILENVKEGDSFYFVHSFQGVPEDNDDLLATCIYNGVKLTAAVRHGMMYGCQFHPEKSGRNGLKIIEKFLSL